MKYNEVSFDALAEILNEEDFVYCPNRGNLGDYAIAHGTFKFFEDLVGEKVVKIATSASRSQLLVFGGGGSLIEGLYTSGIEVIEKHLKKGGRVLILPHTIVGFGDFFVRYSDQLRVVCREKYSYERLRDAGFPESRLYLGHDMAFYLRDKEEISQFFLVGNNLVLKALREDKEKRQVEGLPLSFDVSALMYGFPDREKDAAMATQVMLNIIASHEYVITDRLHVAILSSLIDRKCYLLENSYFKNRAIFEHSLANTFPNTILVAGYDEVPSEVIHAPVLMPYFQNALLEYANLRVRRKAKKKPSFFSKKRWAR